MATDETPGAAPVEPTPAEAPAAPAPPAAPVAPPTAPTASQQVSQTFDSAATQLNQAFSAQGPNAVNPLYYVLCFFLPWLATILNKQTVKGIVFLVVQLVLYSSWQFRMFGGLVWLLEFVDSVIMTNRIAKGETFGDWDFFWKK